MKRILLLAACLFLISPFAHADEDAGAAGDGDFDRWFVLQMQGERAGWAHMTQTGDGETITSDSEMRIALRRGPVTVEVEQSQRFVETADGKPVEASSVMQLGTMAMEAHYTFTDQGIRMVGTQAGQKTERMLPPIQGEWLTPAAAQRRIAAQIDAGAETIRVRTVDLSMGVQPIEATMTVLGEQNVEVFGKTVPAIAWEATIASMPGVKMKEYVDEAGRTLKTTVQVMPGMEIEMLAADEALAKSPVSPPEVMASLMLKPAAGSVAMDRPREMVSAVYEVTLKPEAKLDSLRDLPRAGYQRVVWGDDRTARVVVDLTEPAAPEGDLPTDEHLAASMMVNHEDEKVRELLSQAIPANARLTREGLALALRRFVYDHLEQKSLEIGFATASEVARTREGDCSEHAVLLTALLRAAGIPSRAVTGLVYVDEFIGQRGVFGGHMWTQAWIDPGDGNGGRWVDLDPTLAEHHYDAAHIAQGVASLNDDGVVNELMQMAPLLGSMEIKVVSVEHAETGEPAEASAR